jgi:hypothetical protein
LLPWWFNFVRSGDLLAGEPKDDKKRKVLDELDKEMRIAAVGCLKESTIRSIKNTDDMLKGSDMFLHKSC